MSRISKQAMIDYLDNHFRYYTMNSWNRSTSYAAKVKVYDFVPENLRGVAFDLLETREVYDEIEELFDEFAKHYDYSYQIAANGRSGGYLVLIHGGKTKSEYKTICADCGQKNYREDTKVCGVCGSENMETFSGWRVYMQPGKGIDFVEDLDEDIKQVDYQSLKDDYDLVKHFDSVVEEAKKVFIDYCENYDVVDEEIFVPKTVKVLREKKVA